MLYHASPCPHVYLYTCIYIPSQGSPGMVTHCPILTNQVIFGHSPILSPQLTYAHCWGYCMHTCTCMSINKHLFIPGTYMCIIGTPWSLYLLCTHYGACKMNFLQSSQVDLLDINIVGSFRILWLFMTLLLSFQCDSLF